MESRKGKDEKKLILGMAAAVCGIALAEDSYLYWQINQQGAEKPIGIRPSGLKGELGGGQQADDNKGRGLSQTSHLAVCLRKRWFCFRFRQLQIF